MMRLFATLPLSHVNGTNPWMDSANAPEYPVVAVRLQTGRGSAAQRFGNGASEIVGQSYEPGAHPPR
jgi:hypothetical protein